MQFTSCFELDHNSTAVYNMLRIFAELMFKCVFFRYDNNTPWGEEKFIVPWSFMLWALSVCKTCKSEGKPIDILMLYFSRIGQLQQMMAAYIPMWCVCEYLCLPSFSVVPRSNQPFRPKNVPFSSSINGDKVKSLTAIRSSKLFNQ